MSSCRLSLPDTKSPKRCHCRPRCRSRDGSSSEGVAGRCRDGILWEPRSRRPSVRAIVAANMAPTRSEVRRDSGPLNSIVTFDPFDHFAKLIFVVRESERLGEGLPPRGNADLLVDVAKEPICFRRSEPVGQLVNAGPVYLHIIGIVWPVRYKNNIASAKLRWRSISSMELDQF